MSKAAARVSDALIELEKSLSAYLEEEERHGVPSCVSARSILGECSEWLTTTLLDHLPVIAGPWLVTDMRDGEPLKYVREHRGERLACVRRSGKRGHERWTAWVGLDVVTPPPEDDRVDWPSLEAAEAACDARLREEGVVVT